MEDEAETVLVCPRCGEEICVQVGVNEDVIFVRIEELIK